MCYNFSNPIKEYEEAGNEDFYTTIANIQERDSTAD
jgi:hypothetical protein